MGPQQLSGVMDLIKRDAAARQGIAVDEVQLGSREAGWPAESTYLQSA